MQENESLQERNLQKPLDKPAIWCYNMNVNSKRIKRIVPENKAAGSVAAAVKHLQLERGRNFTSAHIHRRNTV